MIDKRILPLAIGGLGIGTTEFSIMGLLPDIAQSLNVSIPDAGHFISAYALGVVIGAPLIVAFSSKYPPKKVLIWLMVLFSVFNALAAVAPNYLLMIVIRFLSGLPHGAFFGVSTVVAARLAGEGKKAQFISMVFSGLTFANLVMVPASTYIGHEWHWSWVFVLIGIIGLLTILLLHYLLPAVAVQDTSEGSSKIAFLSKGESWYPLIITGIGFGGLFAFLSYIAPLVTQVSHMPVDQVSYVMILVGFGMVVGNLIGGYITDRLGIAKASMLLSFLMLLTLLCVFTFSEMQLLTVVLTFLCGVFSMAIVPSVNIMMLRAAPESEMMSSAFMQAAFNVANALGAYLGGIPLVFGLSYNYPSLIGAGMTVIGLAVAIKYFFTVDLEKYEAIKSEE